MIYQIKVAGELDRSWFDWLGNIKMDTGLSTDGIIVTTLTVDVSDPSRLFGILDHIRDLNITLIAVTRDEGEIKK